MDFGQLAGTMAGAGPRELFPAFDYALGWAAGLLALVAGFALFPALARVRAAPSRDSRRAWLLGGAATLAIGLWGSQNMILLGLDLPTTYSVVLGLSLAALLPGILGAAGALQVLAGLPGPGRRRAPPGLGSLHLAALCLAVGMSGMHHVLVGSLRGDVLVDRDPGALLQSFVLAYGFAVAGFHLSRGTARQAGPPWLSWLGASVFLGLAVLGNAFSALAGTRFFDDPGVVSAGASSAPAFLVPAIMGAVLLVVAVYWLGSVVDGRLAQATEAVRLSEARHRAVIETMLDAHIITDRRGLICSFNPAAAAMFGWQPGEVIGVSSARLFRTGSQAQEAHWQRHRDRTEARADRRDRWVHAEGGLRRDGSRFPIEVAVSPFLVDDEKFYSCTVRDLTERWAAETRMERLAAAIEHAGDAIAILAPDQTIQYVNPQYERMTGFPREEVLGRRPPRGASDEAVYAAIWDTVARGEVWSGQVRGRRRDGSQFDEELTITPVFDRRGAITSYVGVMRDITRRVEADLENRRLAEALQYCSDAIEILDLQGRIVYVNAAYEARSGQKLADIRGSRPEALLDFGPGVESYDDMMRTVYRGGRAWTGTLKLHDIRGELCEEHVTVSPIRDGRGQVTGYVVVKRPVAAPAEAQESWTMKRRALAGECL